MQHNDTKYKQVTVELEIISVVHAIDIAKEAFEDVSEVTFIVNILMLLEKGTV